MKCHFCNKAQGEIPICDNKEKEFLICEDCDNDLFDINTLVQKLIREIDIQIRHHIEEKDIPAVNSLRYIKSLVCR